MKKLITVLSLAVALMALSREAMAAWSFGVNITQLEVHDVYNRGYPSIYLTFDSVPFATSCTGGSMVWIVASGLFPTSPSDTNNDSVKALLSQATAAKLADRTVNVFWNGNCSDGGTSGYPVLVGLQMN